jgi:hypothetical protein
MTLLRQPFTSTGLSTSDGAQACTEQSRSDKAQYKRQHIPMSSPDLTLAEIEAVT